MYKRLVLLSIFFLVAAVFGLTCIGVVMLTSTGAYAAEAKGDPAYFLNRQLFWLGIGLVGCLVATIVDYRWLRKLHWTIYFTALALLVCCYIPGVGRELNGANRWVGFGGISFQPSEMGKLAALIGLAWWFSREETDAKSFLNGFLFPLLLVGGVISLIIFEVDLGTSSLIGCVALMIMFVAGSRLIYLAIVAALGAGGLYSIIHMMPERTGRFMAFLDPEKYPKDAYQQLQGLIAFGSGGTFGLGLGNGRQKFAYLPYSHTDFIFPMVGEELGLPFTLGVVFCFLLLLITGVIVATRASDIFGRLLGFGIVALFVLQAILNMGVTTMLLPNKGLPLPFISYGGSSLVFSLVSVGILVSIYLRGYGEDSNPNAAFFALKYKKMRTLKSPRI